jgi:hypothetical protein
MSAPCADTRTVPVATWLVSFESGPAAHGRQVLLDDPSAVVPRRSARRYCGAQPQTGAIQASRNGGHR